MIKQTNKEGCRYCEKIATFSFADKNRQYFSCDQHYQKGKEFLYRRGFPPKMIVRVNNEEIEEDKEMEIWKTKMGEGFKIINTMFEEIGLIAKFIKQYLEDDGILNKVIREQLNLIMEIAKGDFEI